MIMAIEIGLIFFPDPKEALEFATFYQVRDM